MGAANAEMASSLGYNVEPLDMPPGGIPTPLEAGAGQMSVYVALAMQQFRPDLRRRDSGRNDNKTSLASQRSETSLHSSARTRSQQQHQYWFGQEWRCRL